MISNRAQIQEAQIHPPNFGHLHELTKAGERAPSLIKEMENQHPLLHVIEALSLTLNNAPEPESLFKYSNLLPGNPAWNPAATVAT